MAEFAVKKEFDKRPYSECLHDIAAGVPILRSLQAYGITERHFFKVDAIRFLCEAQRAEQFALKDCIISLKAIADGTIIPAHKQSHRIYMWIAERLMKENIDEISNRIYTMMSEKNKAAQDERIQMTNKKISEDLGEVYERVPSFYDRLSTQ